MDLDGKWRKIEKLCLYVMIVEGGSWNEHGMRWKVLMLVRNSSAIRR